jgi:hypothetical protein
MLQLAQLDYVEACMHETMRLKPVAPFLPLQALKDTVVGDVAVPAGTVVISLLRHDSIDDGFVPEGQVFRPERWLGEDGLSPGSAKRISMPFGAGPRICPGRYLALQEMKDGAADTAVAVRHRVRRHRQRQRAGRADDVRHGTGGPAHAVGPTRCRSGGHGATQPTQVHGVGAGLQRRRAGCRRFGTAGQGLDRDAFGAPLARRVQVLEQPLAATAIRAPFSLPRVGRRVPTQCRG